MQLSITRHGGQYQFWHTDCPENTRESPMYSPKFLDDDVKEFKCAACERSGQITTPLVQVGDGELEEVN